MDFSPIISQISGALWYLKPIAIFAALVKSPGRFNSEVHNSTAVGKEVSCL